MSATLKQLLPKLKLFTIAKGSTSSAGFQHMRSLASLSSSFDLTGKPRMFGLIGNNSGVPSNNMSSLSTNYELKYKEKLLKKAQEEGYESIEEMQEAYKKKQATATSEAQNLLQTNISSDIAFKESAPRELTSSIIQEKMETEDYFSDEDSTDIDFSKSNSKNKYSSTKNLPKSVKPLDQIMKMDLLKDLSKEEIGKIWTNYHIEKKCLSAVVPSESYSSITKNFAKYPTFILPLPRTKGFEFFLVQSQFHQVFFTSLSEYKSNKELSRPYMILTHYTDFFESKGITLMKGEILENNVEADFGLVEAKLLALILQRFYISPTKERKDLLDTFTKTPSQFDYNKLIESVDILD
ncbi:hypothetical protein BB561_006217 [Smittium simulii]|uniref:ATP11-domain-containing protein n=1 Tax=Smittium simulii TaxID=133385 RepID=A0A2T9Y5R8_9FUNG|nr:hypothetical protein BB561_006217 [Smittium simulii]